ncbi:MAG: HK97 family phage prohead protease [Terricaulis sp.]
MKTKTCPMRIKATGAADTGDEGTFEAIVAAYNVDSIGDQIVPGAFGDTLAEWAKSGDAIPVYWSHRLDDPNYNIGTLLDAKETADGLWVKGQLDLDAPVAAQAWRLMKGRRVTQFSFGYDIIDGGPVKKDGQSTFELRKLRLHEVSATPIGMNQATELLATKAEQLEKAGRALSAKNETNLRKAHAALIEASQALGDVLAVLGEPDPNSDGTAKAAARDDDEEPVGAKSDGPQPRSPATFRLLAELESFTDD